MEKINKIPEYNTPLELNDFKSAGANEEMLLPYEEADNKIIVLIKNEGAEATVTVKPGDSSFAGGSDYVIKVPGNATSALAMESGKFKKKDGCVHLVSTANTLSYQIIAMP